MKYPYTVQDLVFRTEQKSEIVDLILEYIGRKVEGLRSELNKVLNGIEKEKTPVLSQKSGFYLSYSKDLDCYFAVKKETYEPECLVINLLDHLLDQPYEEEPLEAVLKEKGVFIAETVALLEKYEATSFSDIEKELIDKVDSLFTYCSMLKEDEMTEQEKERVAEAIDEAYYKPIAESINKALERLNKKQAEISETM